MPSQEYLLKRFFYSPEDGLLRWRQVTLDTHKRPHWWNDMYAGKVVGCPNPDGHLAVHLDHQRFLVSRIIWKMVTGNEPLVLIDHRDRNPQNNIFSNLREATNSQNTSNSALNIKNTTGFKGAFYSEPMVNGKRYPRWQSKIMVNGKVIHLGSFKTGEEAAAAYQAAALKHHGEFACFD